MSFDVSNSWYLRNNTFDLALTYVTYNHLSKVMRDFSKNDPAQMVRYVRRFGHLWMAQRHPKPSLVDVVGLVAFKI
jgi:hypothetical protein